MRRGHGSRVTPRWEAGEWREVARWPDHAKLLGSYVQRNQSKKAHAATVERARFLIKKGGLK